MDGKIRTIKIDELIVYFENPRHDIGQNEMDTIKKLFNAVGVQYMLNLAEDIKLNGLLANQNVVVVYSQNFKKYVVYEGNRRVAAIKLLMNPSNFKFLDQATLEKVKKIAEGFRPIEALGCYITDEEEAFFIMERTHSGEDKGRGTKEWGSREKETFKVRQNNSKSLPYLIDFYTRKFCDDLDITTILPYTTIDRIFNNREIKKRIGLVVSDEGTFSKDRIGLILEAAKWVKKISEEEGVAVTRLFNKARNIENMLLPWIDNYLDGNSEGKEDFELSSVLSETADKNNQIDSDNNLNDVENGNIRHISGGNKNLPYFFQGLNYSHLDPNDEDSHGVSAVCKELKYFSNNKLVEKCPVASAFLIRAIIEQGIIYYSKKHKIQGQNKAIYGDIEGKKLSLIIKQFNKSLSNYITDKSMRQYFNNLFGNYEDNVNPLNWVIHRPAEYQLGGQKLVELPREGLLALINYFLS